MCPPETMRAATALEVGKRVAVVQRRLGGTDLLGELAEGQPALVGRHNLECLQRTRANESPAGSAMGGGRSCGTNSVSPPAMRSPDPRGCRTERHTVRSGRGTLHDMVISRDGGAVESSPPVPVLDCRAVRARNAISAQPADRAWTFAGQTCFCTTRGSPRT